MGEGAAELKKVMDWKEGIGVETCEDLDSEDVEDVLRDWMDDMDTSDAQPAMCLLVIRMP